MSLSPYTIVIGTKLDAPYNVIPNAEIEIRHRNADGTSGSLALIFEDPDGLVPITQTGATVNDRGTLTFYAAAAGYNAVYNNGSTVTQPIDVGVTAANFETNLISVLSQAYIFDTAADMIGSTIVFPVGKTIGRYYLSNGDTGYMEGVVKTAAQAAADGDVIDAATTGNVTLDNGNVWIRHRDELQTKADLAAYATLVPYQSANVLGGDNIRDGFGGRYLYDPASESQPDGDGVIIPAGSPVAGRWIRQELTSDKGKQSRGISNPNDFYTRVASNKRWPKNIIFIGDSIVFGYPDGVLTHKQSPVGVLQTMISEATGWQQGSWPSGGGGWDRYTLAGGATNTGTKGPAARSLLMPLGSTATITGDYIDQIHVFAQNDPSFGSIEVRVNTVLVATIACNGVAANDVLTTVNLGTRTGAGATVELTAITAACELTSVEISRAVSGGGARIISNATPGFSTKSYNTPAVIASLVASVSYSVQPPLYVIALGVNDMAGGAAVEQTSVEYEANLRSLCAGLNNGGIVLSVPIRVQIPIGVTGETFENYRNAVYKVGREFKIPVVDPSIIDFASSGYFQPDNVHLTVDGSAVLANFWYENIGLNSLVTDSSFTQQPLTLGAGITDFGTPYAPSTFSVGRDGKVSLDGAITSAAGTAAFQTIATLADVTAFSYPYTGRPVTQKLLTATAFDGAAGVNITFILDTNGVLQNMNAIPAGAQIELSQLVFVTLG